MLTPLLKLYRPSFTSTVVYMLQSTEYDVPAYLKWLGRVQDFGQVMHRRTLVKTRAAKILLIILRLGMAIQIVIALRIAILAQVDSMPANYFLALGVLLATPVVWAFLIIIPLVLGRWLIMKPRYALEIRRTKGIFAAGDATKIAVAGSYGKTTMKEILLSVLSQGKKTAATPANKNVAISHAVFAKGLKGDEEILIIEYGEGAPGDVARFTKTTKPDIGVITGLAPAHLDKYKTLERAGADIFSLGNYLKPADIYVSSDADSTKPFIRSGFQTYNSGQAAGWKISDIRTDISGLSFTMKKGKDSMKLKSSLLGRHEVGPLALAAALAHRLGLSPSQIQAGVSAVKPFEHRMQPYQLSGAWLIDDTYNGNIEGMRAGLELLKELKAKRKIYVTPGLVDQGRKSAEIHHQLGSLIAKAQPDLVILMEHSVTDDIVAGIKHNGFKGELVIEEDPLNFYTNLEHFVAAGDLVLMQNDWPDNYN